MATRLIFLAFLGLTGFITYNALYLQEQRNGACCLRLGRHECRCRTAQSMSPTQQRLRQDR